MKLALLSSLKALYAGRYLERLMNLVKNLKCDEIEENKPAKKRCRCKQETVEYSEEEGGYVPVQEHN